MKTRVACAVLAACGLAALPAAAETYPNVEIFRLTLTHRTTNLTVTPALDTSPSVSPDAKRIAFVSSRGGPADVYVMSAAGGAPKRVTTSPFEDQAVAWNDAGKTAIAWSPNGKQLAFDVQNATFSPDCAKNCVVWSVYVANADGSGLHLLATRARAPAWSRDGQLIAYENEVTPFGESESVGISKPDGTAVARIAGFNTDPSVAPAWSPRRAELVYQAAHALYTVGADGAERHRLAIGANPTWSPDGTAIAFVRGGALYRVTRSGTALRRLTRGGTVSLPAWSPSRRLIAVLTARHVAVVSAGGGRPRPLMTVGGGSSFDGGPVWLRASALLFTLRAAG